MRSSSERAGGRVLLLATAVVAILLGAGTASMTGLTVAAVGAMTFALAVLLVAEHRILPVVLAVLLLVPFDSLSLMEGPARAAAAGAVLAIAGGVSVIRWRGHGLTPQWGRMRPAFLVWIGVVFALAALHRDTGSLRVGAIWMIALGLYVWVCILPTDIDRRTRSVAKTLGVVGAIQGATVLLDRLLGSTLLERLPGYVPTAISFGADFGARAAGLAGHPLRLGTLCMLAVIVCMSFAMDASRLGSRIRWVALGMPALAGLLLSGARGAWLGLACAFAIGAAARIWSGEAVRRPAKAVGIATVIAAAWFTFSDLVLHRVADVGMRSPSIMQRTAVIDALPGLSRLSLYFGAGFTGYQTSLYSAGLRSANVENEYLLSILSGGIVLLGGLLLLVADTLLLLRSTLTRRDSTVFAALAMAMLVNIATYNMFSWTVGPALFSLVLGSLAARSWHENRVHN